jgi:hypothetical protein
MRIYEEIWRQSDTETNGTDKGTLLLLSRSAEFVNQQDLPVPPKNQRQTNTSPRRTTLHFHHDNQQYHT